MTYVHPYIQTARGHVADEDWSGAAHELDRALDAAKDLEAEVERLREENHILRKRDEDAADLTVTHDEHVAALAEVERLTALLAHQQDANERQAVMLREQAVKTQRLSEALDLIAAPQRRDGTWNRDREACRQVAADALSREDSP